MKLRYKVVIEIHTVETEFAFFSFGSDAEKCVMSLRSQALKDGKSLREYNVYLKNLPAK